MMLALPYDANAPLPKPILSTPNVRPQQPKSKNVTEKDTGMSLTK